MKKLMTLISSLVILVAVALPAQAKRGANRGGAAEPGSCVPAQPADAATPEEAEDLTHMRQEEKLARDVYTALHDTWGLRIFANIAASEQRHTDAIAALMAAYDIADPVVDDTPGVLADPELSQLYSDLVTSGKLSLVEALHVGAMIEDLDIADLEAAIAATDKPEIQRVYTNLLHGSENHLRAFVSQLTSRGESYTPQFISQERFDAIVSAGSGSRRRSGR